MSAIAVFDLTVSANINRDKLHEWFTENCKKFVYQKEQGEETGYTHFQCRFSLKKRRRIGVVLDMLTQRLQTKHLHLTPTSINVAKRDDYFYACKDDTRLEGPWRDSDTRRVSKYYHKTLYPWQQIIFDEIANYQTEGRTINCIVNEEGNNGKTLLANYLGAHGLAVVIPACNDHKELMQFIYCLWTEGKAILADIPRGLSHTASHNFFAALETIKGGMLYEMRYHGKQKFIDPPPIYVFGNSLPDLKLLSKDRWYIRRLTNHSLEDWVFTGTVV